MNFESFWVEKRAILIFKKADKVGGDSLCEVTRWGKGNASSTCTGTNRAVSNSCIDQGQSLTNSSSSCATRPWLRLCNARSDFCRCWLTQGKPIGNVKVKFGDSWQLVFKIMHQKCVIDIPHIRTMCRSLIHINENSHSLWPSTENIITVI